MYIKDMFSSFRDYSFDTLCANGLRSLLEKYILSNYESIDDTVIQSFVETMKFELTLCLLRDTLYIPQLGGQDDVTKQKVDMYSRLVRVGKAKLKEMKKKYES